MPKSSTSSSDWEIASRTARYLCADGRIPEIEQSWMRRSLREPTLLSKQLQFRRSMKRFDLIGANSWRLECVKESKGGICVDWLFGEDEEGRP